MKKLQVAVIGLGHLGRACAEVLIDSTAFSARVMLDAARKLPALGRGAHRYAVGQ